MKSFQMSNYNQKKCLWWWRPRCKGRKLQIHTSLTIQIIYWFIYFKSRETNVLLQVTHHPVAEMLSPMAQNFSLSLPYLPMTGLSSSSSTTLPLVVNGDSSFEPYSLVPHPWRTSLHQWLSWKMRNFPFPGGQCSIISLWFRLDYVFICGQRDWMAIDFHHSQPSLGIVAGLNIEYWTLKTENCQDKGKQELKLGKTKQKTKNSCLLQQLQGTFKLPKT